MPQLILSSRIKSLPFPSFLMDLTDDIKPHMTWDTIFDTIHNKYGINKKVIRLFTRENKVIDYIKKNKPVFNIEDFNMTYISNGQKSGDYWIWFDVFPRNGEKLM